VSEPLGLDRVRCTAVLVSVSSFRVLVAAERLNCVLLFLYFFLLAGTERGARGGGSSARDGKLKPAAKATLFFRIRVELGGEIKRTDGKNKVFDFTALHSRRHCYHCFRSSRCFDWSLLCNMTVCHHTDRLVKSIRSM